ncbi:MAG: DAK2 domain-containing protein [Actinomycetota bacterium]|nr:DAK2 domain-containing protein [Actinomycetota bacterium]
MTTLERLGADHLRSVVTRYRDALRAHQEALNRLNVYPVPDGDTGTNMALTLEAVVTELGSAEPDMAATCKAISHGSLMGARGNSGVILSQILRGLASTLSRAEAADGRTVAEALDAASTAAYGAVMKPVEGTILTVVREAAEAAVSASDGGEAPSLVAVLDAARTAAADALERTPELLAVLKDAGVGDAGGAGFVLLLDAALLVVDGRPVPESEPAPASAVPAPAPTWGRRATDEAASSLRYEVMYFLEASDEAVPHFKDVWAGIGDSIVVVGGEGVWNCHIHTDDIGAAVEAAIDCGRPRDIRVTDLLEQVEEERWVREAAAAPAEVGPSREPVATAVVAVSVGEGVGRIFHSLGVHAVIAGGQSMNPSTAQLLAAVQECPSEACIVLPNNKNIVPVAEQVDGVCDKTVRVVPTRGVAEGFAALLAYDPDASIEVNLGAMTAAAAGVVAGEVTRAVRDSTWEGGPIGTGDWLGIAREGIKVVEPSVADATIGLLDVLVDDDHEIVTLIEGEGARAADTRRITEWMAEHRPGIGVEVHHGGQPMYPYLFGIE